LRNHNESSNVSLLFIKGTKWGALLIAGDDENPKKAAAMKREILELERVVTSKAPRIIGIR
jgi:acyl CoA:acetate/3-ketoacid CoA transferase alpha subunit